MNIFINNLILSVVIISIAGFFQRGVPILNIIGWPVYKIIVASISIIYIVKLYLFYKFKVNRLLNTVLLFIIINVLYYLFTDNDNSFSFLSAILCYFLPIFPIYYYTKKNYISDRIIVYIFILFLIVSVLSFFSVRQAFLYEYYHKEDMTNNIGYLLASIFPYLLFIKKRLYRYVICFFLLALILYSAKRGAILISIVIIFLLTYYTEINNSKLKTKHYIYICFICIISIFIIQYFLETNDYLRERIFTDNKRSDITSGRNEIYSYFFNYYINSDLKELFIGYGFDATKRIYGLHAHNDWLEILIDYGLIGLCITLSFYYCFIKSILSYKKNIYRYSLVLIFTLMILQTLFSMSFFTETMSINSVLLGYLLAKNN